MDLILDQGSVFEIGKNWGRACDHRARSPRWLSRRGGGERPQSYLGGSWEAKTSEKVERFVKLADQFRLPIVHLVDNPGFMIGREAEMAGTIRYGVQAMNAIYKRQLSRLPAVVMRRAYGIAGSAMSECRDRYQYRYLLAERATGAACRSPGGLEVAYTSLTWRPWRKRAATRRRSLPQDQASGSTK